MLSRDILTEEELRMLLSKDDSMIVSKSPELPPSEELSSFIPRSMKHRRKSSLWDKINRTKQK